MKNAKAVPATDVTCNNTALAKIKAHLKKDGRTVCKDFEELKNLAVHYEYRGGWKSLETQLLID